jgi:hypothetical protein
MANLETNTHSSIVVSAGAAAAGDVAVGTITLPAGGPWLIHDIFCQVVGATATAAESIGGHFRFDPASGDLTPDPSPSRFPVFENGSTLGATIDRGCCPLNLFQTEWSGAGKAVINCIYHQAIAPTVAPQIVMGMLYGKSRPAIKPLIFSDVVRIGQIAAADTAIGTITVAEKATRIIGVCGILSQDDVLVTAEELTGFFRLASDDVKLPPMQLPFNNVFGAGLGALINSVPQGPINYIPVDIPVEGGARINAFVDLNTAVTNAADVEIFMAYE